MRSRDVRENFSGVAKLCFREANVAYEVRARDEPLQHTQTRVSRDGGVGFGRMRVSVTTRENVRRERVSFARRDTASRQSVDRVRRR